MLNQSEVKQGFHYFVMGWHLMTQKGLRRFAIMPIVLNTLLLGGLGWLFIQQMSALIANFMDYVPDWLAWLSSILLVLSILSLLVLFYFIFTTVSGFIAAPFNGLLAEKVEQRLSGEVPTEMSWGELLLDVPRMLKREWQKLMYSLPKLIALFLLSFVPFFGQTFVPIIAFLFSAWMMAIQYCDYPFDNHKVPFFMMKNELAMKRQLNLTFGSLISLCTMVPIINLVIMPVAVCGATAMWVEQYKNPIFRQTGKSTSNDLQPSSGNHLQPSKGSQIVS